MIPGINMENGELQIWISHKFFLFTFYIFLLTAHSVDATKTQPWWNDPNPDIQQAAYKIAQRSFHMQADIFGWTNSTLHFLQF